MFKIYDGRSHFYQWDIDRKLIVEDASISEVHFCNQTDNNGLVCKTYIEDGLNLVNVPNILLQNDWRINVYAYDSNYTKFSEQFDVIRRCKPEDYVYTETEVLNYNTLSDRVTKLEEGGTGLEPLVGTTQTITPSQVLAAIKAGRDIALQYTDSYYGAFVFSAFNANEKLGIVVSNSILPQMDGLTGTLIGFVEDAGWIFRETNTPTMTDIDTAVEEALTAAKASGEFDGADGKSAYSYAQDGGYSGTEAEFAAKLAAESIDKALFVVNITTTDEVTYSADKTFDEITQAYNEGKYNIVAVWDGLIMPLSEIIESVRAIFGRISGNDSFLITITYDNKVREEGMLLATIHEKLPNPYPLTFTGAVNETYDGSSAKTIEIPSGGGGSGSYFGVYTVEENVSQYKIPFNVSRYRRIVISVNQPSSPTSLTIGFSIDGLGGSTAKEGGVSSRTCFMFDIIEWTPGTLANGGKYEIFGYSRRNNNPGANTLLNAVVQYFTTEENSLIVSGNDGAVISQGTIITITAIP